MGPRPGELICGHIQLEDLAPAGVGVEALGPVFSARERERDLPLWVTILDRELFPSELALSTFMAAANEWLSVRHPGLLPMAVVDRESEYCVVGHERWPDIRSLADILMLGPGVPEPEQVDGCAVALARILAFLHGRGLVHGALSPASCFVWERTYLLWQHGIAALCDHAALIQRARHGADWLRPDLMQAWGVSPELDVFGWGVTIARMAYLGEPVEAVNAVLDGDEDVRIGSAVLEVVRAALQTTATSRSIDGRALVALLEARLRRVDPQAPLRSPPSVPRSRDGIERSLDAPEAGLSSEALRMEDLEEVRVEESVPPPLLPGRGGPFDSSPPRVESAAHPVRTPEQEAPLREEPDLLRLVEASSSRLRQDEEPSALPAARDREFILPVPAPVPIPGPRSQAGADGTAARSGVLRPPRTPGPHGPSPAVMMGALAVMAVVVPGLAFLHTVGVRGGLASMFSTIEVAPPPIDDRPRPLEAGAVGDTSDEGNPAAPEESGGGRDIMDEPEPEPTPTASPSETLDRACPMGMVLVSPRVCMDVGEWPGLRRKPQVGFTLEEAAATCDRAGKRLCSREEWARTCAGSASDDYPYGPVYEAGSCNTASVAGFPAELAISGSYPRCRSEAGVYDLVGNVGEWVSDGLAVGGDRMTEGERATCAAQGHPPAGYSGPDLGFRCCWDVSE